ncbi:MAG: hypothetical protein EA363_02865 [Balneolaceae bacterium]|nr:MAG: hypothetical protein EA363_02865 [Balneolaceae bacterium]
MKDIVIKAKVVKRELMVLLAAFVLSFLLNIYAIIVYDGQWSELLTQFHVVILLTLFLYFLALLIRLIYLGVRFLWRSISSKSGKSAA